MDDIIRDIISEGNSDEAFYVLDIEDIILKHRKWMFNMPRVRPYYAVKCNPNTIVLQVLSGLGVGFDCASKSEIDCVLNIGVNPDLIIYANTCKARNYIKYAAECGVECMTFDNKEELFKVKQFHPKSRLVLRIRVEDSHSLYPLGLKFGAQLTSVEDLLQTAKDLELDIIGCSFHVGCGCLSASAFTDAIADAKQVFGLGLKFGFKMTLLDIGGGFPGTLDAKISFETMAKAINIALELHFPLVDDLGNNTMYTIISEPGTYYVASAFTIATNIIGKSTVELRDNQIGKMYFLNEGFFGSFHYPKLRSLFSNTPLLSNNAKRGIYLSTLWGQSCHHNDYICREVMMPEMDIGEWILFKNHGDYSLCFNTGFNGFDAPVIKPFVSALALEELQALPNWPSISVLLGINDELKE